jgi:hypothetical protein
MGTGPIERRLRELGGVKALVVGAFAEHSADVHTPVDGLAEAARFRARAITTWSIHRRRRGQQKHCCTRLSARQPGTCFVRCLEEGAIQPSGDTRAVALGALEWAQ